MSTLFLLPLTINSNLGKRKKFKCPSTEGGDMISHLSQLPKFYSGRQYNRTLVFVFMRVEVRRGG